MDNIELVTVAKRAMNHSYSPYSKFKVGAAVLCDDGSVYSGCNIENASFGATICAERVAISSCIADGQHSISKIAIVSSSNKFTYPCGICRQVMSEFMKDDAIIILSEEDKIKEFTLNDLIPNIFHL